MKYLVPIIALLIGVIFAVSIVKTSSERRADDAADRKAVQADGEQASSDSESAAPDDAVSDVKGVADTASKDDQQPVVADTTETPAADDTDASAEPAVKVGELHPLPAKVAEVTELGSLEADSPHRMKVKLTAWGAGVMRIELKKYFLKVRGEEHYPVLIYTVRKDRNGNDISYFPFAARVITVNGQRIALQNIRWHKDADNPGLYYIDLADETETPRLRIVRHYKLGQVASGYDLNCIQTVENLTDQEMTVIWEQYGQNDIPKYEDSYLGDRRMMMAGYFNPSYDAKRKFVFSDHARIPRDKVRGNLWEREVAELSNYPPDPPLFWPNEDVEPGAELVWVASLNRYFALTVHPLIDEKMKTVKGFEGKDGIYPNVSLSLVGGHVPNQKMDTRPIMVSLQSKQLTLPADGKLDLSVSLFAGPRDHDVLEHHPYDILSLENMIVYELGCTICTFQWLAHGLLAFLKFLHAIVFDWAIAIIILVLVVRACLHPITKKSQINMAKMGKQMQSMQPEIEKLKKKYANDQQKFQQEQMKLWREKGVNPANMLGCLPMLLQSPIWIALYAMLFFAIELRHEPAFYGFFQLISGDKWMFLADLSAPDHFIQFPGEGFTIPLYFINPKFQGINIVPILMGIMFFFQQKLTMQPAMNEQQEQQQKMMKFMTLLFPFFLYSAPSGLTLYILASTSAGMVDSYFVRKHIKEQEAEGTLLQKKPPKPGSLRDRMSKWVEKKMREAQDMQDRRDKGGFKDDIEERRRQLEKEKERKRKEKERKKKKKNKGDDQ